MVTIGTRTCPEGVQFTRESRQCTSDELNGYRPHKRHPRDPHYRQYHASTHDEDPFEDVCRRFNSISHEGYRAICRQPDSQDDTNENGEE